MKPQVSQIAFSSCTRGTLLAFVLLISLVPLASAQPSAEIDSLGQEVEALAAKLNQLEERSSAQTRALMGEIARLKQTSSAGTKETGFIPGGYGEIHFNGTEGTTGEMVDIHRFVLYLGYKFNDWIQLNSETEIEHAFVADGDGEVAIEQLSIDFLLNHKANVRAGRILVPMGIVNQRHEPPLFNGVERPFVDTNILPSTWFGEGVGLFGAIGANLTYEIYLLNGLDASGFSSASGIRGGRMKERPGYTDPAFTGRIDIRPADFDPIQAARFGIAAYSGGGNNGNRGSVPDLDVRVNMIAFDGDLKSLGFDLRAELAYGMIDGAEQLSGVGSELFGWYAEGARDILPSAWKQGKLARAGLKLFARYEVFNTQYSMPEGVAASGTTNRHALTTGFSFLPVEKVAIKGDVQFRGDEAGSDLPMLFNLGLGWMF